MFDDTIAAISTAVSESGIGIIRISGKDAFSVIDQIYKAKGKEKKLSAQPSHTIHYGYIADGDEIIDEVLVSIMCAPRTFTAENTVEINCHGGVYVMKRVLETVLKNGARAAEPGEFTRRAFLNGRIDLSRAEAVMDLIQSKNEYALKSSVGQLRGSVYETISRFRQDILHEIAFIEAALDDPEHYSLDDYPDYLQSKVDEWKKQLGHYIESFENGRLIREGINTVIVGRPNAGKSSVLNRLLGENRAIVTDIPGTTRDLLTETITLNGLTLNIIDTAGIRNTEDPVEKIGVERAKGALNKADLVLFVLDSSQETDENDKLIMDEIRDKKSLILLNKSDLKAKITAEDIHTILPQAPVILLSALTGEGINDFIECIRNMFFNGNLSFNDEVMITNIRQKNLLIQAMQNLEQVESSLAMQMPEDFLSIDLAGACENLGQITGDTTGEDLVNEIFSKFCMGK